ncbi:MAG: protein kinase [Candidatus Schekmanbacteria bacterium]|nr:protein kinase [Candidatus Schekmanbacteria bacterium]
MTTLPNSLGPYRLLDVLGSGGMGVVYRGVHRDTGQVAAIKTVRLPRSGILASLRREIHALSRLRHPGIVRIFHHGVADGLPWYAMELLEGERLDHYARVRLHRATAAGDRATLVAGTQASEGAPPPTFLSQTQDRSSGEATLVEGMRNRHEATLFGREEMLPPPPPKEDQEEPPPLPVSTAAPEPQHAILPAAGLRAVLSVLCRLCEALAFLHGEGFVHRDLKPANVLVRADGTPVLVDFGLLARFGGKVSREVLQPLAALEGTLPYMSPEQIDGRVIDARADLYSLGCMIYELVTGRPPFVSEVAMQLIGQHLMGKPEPPSALVGELPEDLERLTLRLLEKAPVDRPGYADVVAAALRDLGGGGAPAPAAPPARPYLHRPALAGRADALERLVAYLDPLTEGRGNLVFLGGESGVGKTRLALEVAWEAQKRNIRVLSGECLGAIEKPLEPFLRPLQALADACREGGVDETNAVLGERGKLLAVYQPALLGLPGQAAYGEPAELPSAAARLRLAKALMESLAALGRARPVLLILDDLQWADELTAYVLGHLWRTRALPRANVLVLALFRSDEENQRLRSLIATAGATALRLDRIDSGAVSRVVREMLALPAPPLGLGQFLARHSEGNPFFVGEYLRAAVEESLLWRDPQGHWRTAGGGAAEADETVFARLPLPTVLQELVAQRLHRLSADEVRLVWAAGLCGREISGTLLREIAKLGLERYFESLQTLLRRGVFEEAGDDRLRFTHDKLRAAAHELIPVRERPRLHRTVAESIEHLSEGDSGDVLGELAFHWEAAGERSKARRYYLEGARHAKSRYANEEAERLYRGYLALVEAPTEESVAVRRELGLDVLSPAGQTAAAIAELERSLADARLLGDRRGELRAHTALAFVGYVAGEHTLLWDNAEQAIDLAGTLNDPVELARAENIMGIGWGYSGRSDKAIAHCSRAAAIAKDHGDQAALAMYLGNVALEHSILGHHEKARTMLRKVLKIHRDAGDRHKEATVLTNLANDYYAAGELDMACRLSERAAELHRQVGNRGAEAVTLSNLVDVLLDQGHLGRARAQVREVLGLCAEIGDRVLEASSLCRQARIRRHRNLLREAEASIDKAMQTLSTSGAELTTGLFLCEKGHLALAMGRSAAAVLARAKELAAALGSGEESLLGVGVAKLARAQEAFAAGERDRLLRGELLAEMPEGLRRVHCGGGKANAE